MISVLKTWRMSQTNYFLKSLCVYRVVGGLPLFTGLPRRLILGNPDSYARIPIRYRGVGKRACSTSFLVEFFPESYWLCLERLRNFHAKAPKKITMKSTMLPHSTNVTLSEGWPKNNRYSSGEHDERERAKHQDHDIHRCCTFPLRVSLGCS